MPVYISYGTLWRYLKINSCYQVSDIHSIYQGKYYNVNTWVLGIALGFMVYCFTVWPTLPNAVRKTRHNDVLPDPLGPTMTTPILCLNCSYSSRAFLICTLLSTSPNSSVDSFNACFKVKYSTSWKWTPGNTSRIIPSNRLESANVSFDKVFKRTAWTTILVSVVTSTEKELEWMKRNYNFWENYMEQYGQLKVPYLKYIFLYKIIWEWVRHGKKIERSNLTSLIF